MHKNRILFLREPEVHTILRRCLSKIGYRIYPKVRLSDAIAKDQGEWLPDREFEYLCKAHLDFLIVKDDFPVFAVEFDGLQHLEDAHTIARDVMKNRLCKAADLPLLRITSREIFKRDEITSWTTC